MEQRLREEGFFNLDHGNEENNDHLITWEESRTLPYADAVINEVLRMAPPVSRFPCILFLLV